VNGLSAFCLTDSSLPLRHNTWRLDAQLEAPAICEPLSHNARRGPPPCEERHGSPWNTPASRVSLKAATVESNRAEFGVQWKDEIKRLVELLLTTDDLRAVQSLTVEVQRALYLRIEQLQRELAKDGSAHPKDSSVFEIGPNNPSASPPLPKPNEEP
jgi:hypothetical protein